MIELLLGDLGFPIDQIKTVICLLFSYPAAMVMKRMPSANMKHIFNIVLGLSYCIWCLGTWSWVHSFISSLIVYGLVCTQDRRKSPISVFAFCMIYLSVSHVYRMSQDYMGWTLDYTGPQMILTLKLTSFAWNLSDGSRPESELTPDQKKRAIKKIPTLLEFYGFVYFFPTFLAGPTIEITDYLGYTSLSMFSDVKKGEKMSTAVIPSSNLSAVKALITGLFMMPFVILAGYYPVTELITVEFAALPLVKKIVFTHFIIALSRFKYYFGWFVSEGSAILSGIGYNGYNEKGQIQWNRINNVNPLKVELASNIKDVSDYWNIGTSSWLKRYIYLRLTPPGQKPTFFATLATYATSAIWHGFYPGYYFFFINATFLTEISKDLRRKVRPYFVKGKAPNEVAKPLKPLYDILATMATEWWLSYFGQAFISLSLSSAYIFWKAFNFLPMIILYVGFIVFRYVIPTPRDPSRSTTPQTADKKSN